MKQKNSKKREDLEGIVFGADVNAITQIAISEKIILIIMEFI